MYTACNDNKEAVVFDNSETEEGEKDETRIPSDIRKARLERAVIDDVEGKSLPHRVIPPEHSMLNA